MPKLLDRTRAALKAFWGSGDWVSSNRPGNRYSSGYEWGSMSGTNLNYEALVGPLWQNSAVAAVLNWQIRAWKECKPRVYRLNAEGKEEEVKGHPLTRLLQRPNPFYPVGDMWAATILSYNCAPRAYWIKNRNGGARPVEYEYVPHFWLKPDAEDTDPRFVQRYLMQNGRDAPRRIPAEDVIPFRYSIDPCNMRGGLYPLESVYREVYSDIEATNYIASVLKNRAVGVIVSPKESGREIANGEQLRRKMDARLTGGERGSTTILEEAIALQEFGVTPEKLTLDKIRQYPEARVCAVTGVVGMVCGLSIGQEQKTYSNWAEAIDATLNNNFLPTQQNIADALTFWALPDFNAFVPGNEEMFVGFCNDHIKALQDDVEEVHSTVREDYKAGLIDRAIAKILIGQEPTPEDEGVYYPATGTPDEQMLAPPEPPALPGVGPSQSGPEKSLFDRYRERAESYRKFNPNHDPHSGQFAPGGGGAGAGSAAVTEATPSRSARSLLAQQTSRRVAADVQRYSEEHCEPILAKQIKGVSLRDNEPIDVMVTRGGKVTHGVELKTMTDNKNNKITMKSDAMARKANWMRENKADYHTIVFDDHKVFNANGPGKHGSDSDRVIYYRRGFGSFRVGGMHKVKDTDELNKLLDMKTDDLPAAARPPKTYPKVGD